MNDSYVKLIEIKNSCRFDHFVMAVSHYLDIGHRNAKEITQEDIDSVEENGLMTKEFCQFLMRTAKIIADSVDSAVEVIQFCTVEDIFETRFYAGKLSRGELEDMVKARLANEDDDDTSTLCELYDCDEEDLEMLGMGIPEVED